MGRADSSRRRIPDYGGRILLVLSVLCGSVSAGSLFVPEKEYVYHYSATSSSGVLLPSRAASSWGLRGNLVIRAEENSALIQLRSLKMHAWNGPLGERGESTVISTDVEDLLKPFRLSHKAGLVENFSVEAEPTWSLNIKRSIAGILQLDLDNLKQQSAYHSLENNHYGQCEIEYVVISEADDEKLIRKSLDPRSCRGHQDRTWSNVPRMPCPNTDQNPILKSSERVYRVKSDGDTDKILYINATGGIYVQPFQSLGEAQFLFTEQTFELVSVGEAKEAISANEMRAAELQHELPERDLTQGRGVPEKTYIFKSIGVLLDRLSQRLENPGLDTEVNNLHNTTVSVLLYYLEMLDRDDLQTVYKKISGTSYKEETIRNMLLEMLPQVGSREAALFVLDLIQQKRVSDIAAIQLLTHLPFHVRKLDVQLLVSLQPLLNLPRGIAAEVQNTGILTFGTFIYKTCLVYCPYEMLDDYVRLYLDKFTESQNYGKKMVWLQGLANIQLGRVVEFLKPIADNGSKETRHLRFLAAWASMPTAPFRPDVIYPLYWPILTNRTEHLEMRIAALTLLIISNPTQARLTSLYWYMHGEPDPHLYNFFYTTMKSIERTNFPCYIHIGNVAAQFTRILRKPSARQHIVTGNYLFDYQDTQRHFGAMLQSLVIADPVTNVPTVFYVTLNNHGVGITLNNIALYIKAEGVLDLGMLFPRNFSRVREILRQFKVDDAKKTPVHVEIIARVQEKTVLCLNLNETNMSNGYKYLNFFLENANHVLENMEFHVNLQRINVPLTMESVQVTDLGTNARLAVAVTSLFSMRGNFTHVPIGRNNHVILRTSIHGTETIESYNPLIDLWHGAERAQSLHGYFPINVTVGLAGSLFLSYNTPNEHVKTGITAHVRTSTNIRGPKSKSKLTLACPSCSAEYVVKKNPQNVSQNLTLFDIAIPEMGGQIRGNVFDCDSDISQSSMMEDVLSSHRSNYQIWPVLRSAMIGIHVIDYFTYVPPGGSCGLAVHAEPFDLRSSEVKFEYSRSRLYHMLALTRRETESSVALHQWNIAILVDAPDWTFQTVKIKATRKIPGEKVKKICVEVENDVPWEWDFFATTPSKPATMKFNIDWGSSDTAKGKCSGSSVLLNLVGEISAEQKELSEKDVWPYRECREESQGKRITPYTDACYEVSKELSTLRKYQIFAKYENLPSELTKAAYRLRAIYDLIGGNSSGATNSDQFIVVAQFPRDSNVGELRLNNDKVAIPYSENFIDFFLTRTRVHKFTESTLVRTLFGTCALRPTAARSPYNTSIPLGRDREILVLGHCHDEQPGFALGVKTDHSQITLMLYDESDDIKIQPEGSGGALYNYTDRLPLKPDYSFYSLNTKRVRLDNESIDLVVPEILLFVHWTQEQVLLFYPNYVRGLSCGVCATRDPEKLYERN